MRRGTANAVWRLAGWAKCARGRRRRKPWQGQRRGGPVGFERVEVTEQAMEEVRVAEAMGAAWAWRRMRAFEEDSVDAARM